MANHATSRRHPYTYLTRVLSGPYCTMLLGDLGAEVIKVERPREGDDTRAFAPPFQGDQAAYFLSINRNKKSITLDMKSERGKEILWRLVDVSDVLVENFRPAADGTVGLRLRGSEDSTPVDDLLLHLGLRRYWTAEGSSRL
jgi:CoA transferase family III